jgi:ribonuclease Z
VLVTHLHSDHLTDLNDVITTRWVISGEPSALPIFGPPGIGEVVDATLRIEDDERSVVVGGGGVPCPGLDELCQGASAYVQTVIREDLVRQVPSPRFQDILDYHSTVEGAARTAARAAVGTLVLMHYVPPMALEQSDEWRALAVKHFGGEIVLGDDLTTVDV